MMPTRSTDPPGPTAWDLSIVDCIFTATAERMEAGATFEDALLNVYAVLMRFETEQVKLKDILNRECIWFALNLNTLKTLPAAEVIAVLREAAQTAQQKSREAAMAFVTAATN